MKSEVFHLYGMKITTYGDVEKARELTGQARKMQFQLGLSDVPKLNLHHPDGSYVQVLRQAGMDFANIYVPPIGSQIKSKQTKTERFLPAIGMRKEEDNFKYYNPSYDDIKTVVFSICSDEKWNGSQARINTIVPYDPGMKPADIVSQGLYGLENHGCSDFNIGYDYEEIKSTVFNDWPDDIDPDDEIAAIIGGPDANSYVYDADLCPNVDDWLINPPPSTIPASCPGDSVGLINYAVIRSNTYTDCGDGDYVNWEVNSDFYHYQYRGYRYKTWAYYFLDRMNVVADVHGINIMGICFDNIEACEGTRTIESAGTQTLGSKFIYLDNTEHTWSYTVTTDDIIDRPSGNIKSKTFSGYSYNNLKKELLTPCECRRTDYYDFYDPYTYNDDVPGAYITSDNKIKALDDKYIILYQADDRTTKQNVTQNNCDIDGGNIINTYGFNLYVDVNGEVLLLDSCTERYKYFIISDSHIFTSLGSIYYMYAYSVYETYYGIHYTVYGYFKNDINNHFQSEKYIPVGFKQNDYITPHHDVAGSSKLDTPLYGVGKCAGYLSEIINKEEGI